MKDMDLSGAEWSLLRGEVGIVFRATYMQNGLRHTSFFYPQDLLNLLNKGHAEANANPQNQER